MREDPPRFVEPMLAAASAPPEGEGWSFEVKWDGMRGQVRWDGLRLCVRSRPGRDCTAAFGELEALGAALGGSRQIVLDGEIVCLGPDGAPAFSRLRRRVVGDRRGGPATFMAFDVLHLDGGSTRGFPYHARRELLEGLALDGAAWRTPRAFTAAESAAMIATTRERFLEGVVAKRLDALYEPGRRSGAWVKHKHRRREAFTITGWRPAENGRPRRSSLDAAKAIK